MIRSRAASVNNTNANSPPAGKVKPKRQEDCGRLTRGFAEKRGRDELDRQKSAGDGEYSQRHGLEQPEVGSHADRDKEQPEQQAFERLEIRFQLVSKFTVGQQHAGQEGAE